jgi:predicted glycosyltransferase
LEEAAVAGWPAVGLTPGKVQATCRYEYAADGTYFL